MALLSYNTTTKAVGEFQNLNQWLVEFSFPQTTIPDDVKFRCVSTELPSQEFETISATINRFELTQPSHTKRNGSITLEFTDSTKAETTKLWDAIDKIKFSMDDKDATGLSQGWLNIKGTMLMYLLDSQGNKTQGYKLLDCDLKPQYEGSLSSDAEILRPKLEIAYNWWNFIAQN